MNNENRQKYVGSISFFTTCLIVLLIVVLIHIFVQDTLDTEYILGNFLPQPEFFVAENAEKASYITSVISFPIIFLGVYLFFKKHILDFSEKKLKTIMITEVILAIIAFPLFTLFSPLTRVLYSLHFYIPIIPFITTLLFAAGYMLYEKKSKYTWILNTFIVSMMLFYITNIFLLYNTPTYNTASMDLHHFEAYFYPIYKTLSGLTPGIDFRNLYGFYPYIYSLFFNVNNISIAGVSLFNASLITIIFISLAFILFFNIKNKMLAFLIYNVCLLYSLFSGLNNQISRHGIFYLQYMPHRVFFVMLIALLITIYPNINNEKIKKVMEYIGYIICSVALFWNIESGIAALAGWSALHFYLSLNKPDTLKRIIKIFIQASLTIFTAFLAIFICTYVHSHQIINPLGMFFGQFVFYTKGFYMIKMDVFKQPFMLVLIVYFISLADSIVSAIENKVTKNSIIKFSFSVIGFGLFTYFQGRSHVLCLIACSWPMYILLGILMEEYIDKYKEHFSTFTSKISILKFSILFILVSFVSTSCMFYMSSMPNHIKSIKDVFLKKSEQIENLKLLNKSEQYDILTQDASFYYMYLKQPDLLPFSGICDLFLQSDLIKIDNYLRTSNKKLIVDDNIFKYISVDYLNTFYNLVDANDYIYVFEKKK